MRKISFSHAAIFLGLLLLSSCGWLGRLGKLRPISLKFHDQYRIPSDQRFEHTSVRGLSGIDYNPAKGAYYLISDDRSLQQPSRYYTADIRLNGYRIDTIVFTRVDSLRNDQGTLFPPRTADPEAIRFDGLSGFLAWSSEGEKIIQPGREIIQQPFIRLINKGGMVLDSFRVPQRFQYYAYEKGARNNGSLEAMSYTPDYRQLWLCMEEPLYEDGPRIDTADNNSYLRLFGFDRFTGKQVGEFAYQAEKVAYAASPADAYRINGVSEILFLDSTRFLVMERSFSTGRRSCTVRIFLANLAGATDITGMESLALRKDIQPVSKKLLFDFNVLNRHIDNLEGMCWGPELPNGHRSLLLISDDNFSDRQETQLFLLELVE
jgi:hypothetical protein